MFSFSEISKLLLTQKLLYSIKAIIHDFCKVLDQHLAGFVNSD